MNKLFHAGALCTEHASYAYHNYENPDPPHQPLYLKRVVRALHTTGRYQVVLDAGCGDGNFAASLSEYGFTMYGIDLSSGAIDRARQNWPQISFAEASVYDDLGAVFPGVDQFDAIVSIEVIEHLYSPRTFMRRALDGLRTGGVLILTTPYWGYVKNIVLAVSNRLDLAHTALWDGGHIKHWSYRTLRSLGEQAGFTFIAFEGAGRPVPFLWNGMMMVFQRST
ncbi:MAG: class I SAM-dependent methyltransferase [Acidobacteria bacterium]|nr:class I SAM-dependent methyltransferase [Acidobacteriota bacterium]